MTQSEVDELTHCVRQHQMWGFTNHVVVIPVTRPELVGKDVQLDGNWYPTVMETTDKMMVRSW